MKSIIRCSFISIIMHSNFMHFYPKIRFKSDLEIFTPSQWEFESALNKYSVYYNKIQFPLKIEMKPYECNICWKVKLCFRWNFISNREQKDLTTATFYPSLLFLGSRAMLQLGSQMLWHFQGFNTVMVQILVESYSCFEYITRVLHL